ncbi:MAG: cytochrome P450, partial [Rubrivivax sp.]|nr:cytochrome P450 [Rubrivivax sp.]
MNDAAANRGDGADRVDMRDPGWRADPHPLLRELRERSAVARDVLGIWLVGRHADVNVGLRSTKLSREPWRAPVYRQLRPFIADSPMEVMVEQWMLFNDPPKHTRLRRLANQAFRPPVIDAMTERIEAVADELIDALPADGTFDLMTDFAQPLPVRVICDVLGLPARDFAATKAWSDALALIVEPVRRRADLEAAGRAAQEMADYLRTHIARHRSEGRRDDLLGALVAAQDDGSLSDDELLGNLILLFVAGHETTTNLIGNGVATLLRHPGELARLRKDPSLGETAVNEMLRYEGSVNFIARHPIEPYRIGDFTIEPGETIFFMLGAANRDPTAFADPERFDIGRTPNHQLGFGAGIHFCIGAPLARLEARIALNRLLARFPVL